MSFYPYPVEFIMTEYMKHKRDSDQWYSPPFCTGPGGYKLCLRVAANGRGVGCGTHVSVHVYLMRGEYDKWLVWPFCGAITIRLVDQSNNEEHFERTVIIPFDDTKVEYSQRVMETKEKAEHGFGFRRFMLQNKLNRYLKNGCLKIRVTEIVVYSI